MKRDEFYLTTIYDHSWWKNVTVLKHFEWRCSRVLCDWMQYTLNYLRKIVSYWWLPWVRVECSKNHQYKQISRIIYVNNKLLLVDYVWNIYSRNGGYMYLQPASNPANHRKHVIRATAHATDVTRDINLCVHVYCNFFLRVCLTFWHRNLTFKF
jgi:hypothetical protein